MLLLASARAVPNHTAATALLPPTARAADGAKELLARDIDLYIAHHVTVNQLSSITHPKSFVQLLWHRAKEQPLVLDVQRRGRNHKRGLVVVVRCGCNAQPQARLAKQ